MKLKRNKKTGIWTGDLTYKELTLILFMAAIGVGFLVYSTFI